jgi:tetratricopeptide (TPR) repeat protein
MRRSIVNRVLVLSLSLACFGAISGPGDVWAQDGEMTQEERAKKVQELATEGAKAFNAKDYRKAIEYFEKAYAVEPVPNLLYNIGKCHEKLEQWRSAQKYYKKFAVAPDVSSEAREEALASVDRIRSILEMDGDGDGVPDVDDECPETAGVAANDGCEATADAGGKAGDGGTDGGNGGGVPDEPVEPPKPNRTPAYLVGGTGLLLVGGGAVFGVLANARHADFESGETADQRRQAADAGRTMALTADILYVAGGAALLTGIILYATASPPDQPEASAKSEKAQLTPWFSGEAAGMTFRLQF